MDVQNVDFVAEKSFNNSACQVNTFIEDGQIEENTFSSNSFYFENGLCEVAVQTDLINSVKKFKITPKICHDKHCGTDIKTVVDVAVGSSDHIPAPPRCFNGFSSIKEDDQLSDLAGVSFANFKVLLDMLESNKAKKISKENRLLMFLMKLKTGMTYSAISVLFSVHRTTVSDIFLELLVYLAAATEKFVFWPSKRVVQGTMPACFEDKFSQTRVIIDCTEFKIEIPSKLEDRVWCYSHYKHGFTAKVLIGITPGGFISFKSKVAGGRKSDSQITTESGLVDLLEDGDIVLADKGFPEIKSIIDKSGTEAFLVMPPFLERKKEFSKEETNETYSIASVRVHVERIMQRIRVYKILDKIPASLFPQIDRILHVCCVLVNLQPPIFADKEVVN